MSAVRAQWQHAVGKVGGFGDVSPGKECLKETVVEDGKMLRGEGRDAGVEGVVVLPGGKDVVGDGGLRAEDGAEENDE